MSEDKPDAHLATLDVTDSEVPSAAPAAAEQLPEVRAARYRMAEEVGRGGLGRVLRARDVFLDRTVAIKELHSDDEASRRRFVREALITARLQHPSIVPVYEAGRWPDRSPFYAMKLVSGRALSDVLGDKKTLAERLQLVPTVLAVADAIAYAHHERIVHRDLKPHNVLVGAFGETVVIDWGLAKDLAAATGPDEVGPYRAAASAEQTVAGAVLGTPAYMAPEQASGDDVDERTDVYALGAMLYQVIAGAPPHGGKSVDEVLVKILQGDIVPLAQREPAVPPDLAAVVAKAMALAPGDRYRTAAELADDLRRFTNGQLVGAHRYTLGERVRRWIRRHRAVTAVASVAIVVLAVFATWSIRRIFREIDRADRERDTAVAASQLADEQRDEAIAQANRAVLAQARAALATDHSVALAWLKRLDPAGPGWGAARMIAASALDRPQLRYELRGSPMGYPEVSPDGRWIAVSDFMDLEQVWLIDAEHGVDRHVKLPVIRDAAVIFCDDGRHAIVSTQSYGDEKAPIRPARIELETGKVEMLDPAPEARARSRATCARAWRHVMVDGALRWSDGAAVETLIADAAKVTAVRSHDGQTMVTADAKGRLTWWDGTSAAARASFEAGRTLDARSRDAAVVGSAAPVPIVVRRDGTRVALGDEPAIKMALAPDGRWAAVLHDENYLSIRETTTGAWLRSLESRGEVTNLLLSEDGRYLFGIGKPLQIWDLHGPGAPITLPGDRVTAVEFGDVVAPGFVNLDLDVNVDALRIWTRPDPMIWTLPVEAARVSSAVFSSDARSVVVHADVVRRIDLTGATPPEVITAGPPPAAHQADTVEVSPDLRWMAVARKDGPADLIDTGTWEIHRLAGSSGTALAFDGEGNLATGGDGGALLLWDTATRTSRPLGTVADDVTAAAFAPGGRRLAFGCDRTIVLVDLADATLRQLTRRSTYAARAAVEFVASGDVVVTGDETFLRMIDFETAESRMIEIGQNHEFHAFAVTDDGVVVIGDHGVYRYRDDLPRDPAALAAMLAAMPYDLDEKSELVLRPRP